MKKLFIALLLSLIMGLTVAQIYEEPTPDWLNGIWSFDQNNFSFYYHFDRNSNFKKVNNSGYVEEEGTYTSGWDDDYRINYYIKFYDKSGKFIKRFKVTYAENSPHDPYSAPWCKMIILKDGYGEYPRTMWKKIITQHLQPPRKKDNVDKIIDLIFGK